MSVDLTTEMFKEKWKSNPSIYELNKLSEDEISKLTSKSHVLWFYNKSDGEINYKLHRIYEYDSGGILIYSRLVLDDNKKFYDIFILFLENKTNIVEYVVKTLNKKK